MMPLSYQTSSFEETPVCVGAASAYIPRRRDPRRLGQGGSGSVTLLGIMRRREAGGGRHQGPRGALHPKASESFSAPSQDASHPLAGRLAGWPVGWPSLSGEYEGRLFFMCALRDACLALVLLLCYQCLSALGREKDLDKYVEIDR